SSVSSSLLSRPAARETNLDKRRSVKERRLEPPDHPQNASLERPMTRTLPAAAPPAQPSRPSRAHRDTSTRARQTRRARTSRSTRDKVKVAVVRQERG